MRKRPIPETYTLVYFSSKASLLMIKSHDKNQSIDLIGLAHAEKAYSRNWLFLGQNRPYWRELRPLVTPWAWCIKEGTDPWKGETGSPFSCPAPAPRTKCIGGQVARFWRPFEARPVDPVRREVFRQLVEEPSTAATSGWIAPTEALASTPPPLVPGTEECASRTLPKKVRRKRKRTSPRHQAAPGN